MLAVFLTRFVMLTGAHYIGDYALQSDYLANNKGTNLYVLTAHSAIWSFCIALTGYELGVAPWWWAVLLILFIPHFVVDKMKARKLYFFSNLSDREALAQDQIIHLFQILVYLAVTM